MDTQPEPTDPFQDVRNARMSELNDEQRDRAAELWMRDQKGWLGPEQAHRLEALFRIIDRLRAVRPVSALSRKPMIELAVSRLMSWYLPRDFQPDCFVSFDREAAAKTGSWPTGTNLFSYQQAVDMLYTILPATAHLATSNPVGHQQAIMDRAADQEEVVSRLMGMVDSYVRHYMSQEIPIGELYKSITRQNTEVARKRLEEGIRTVLQPNRAAPRRAADMTDDELNLALRRRGWVESDLSRSFVKIYGLGELAGDPAVLGKQQ